MIKKLLLLTVISVFGVAVFASQAWSVAEVTITQPVAGQVIPEQRDFPSEHFSDPWDMTRYTDISGGEYITDLENVQINSGVLSASTSGEDAGFHPLFPGYEGVLFNGRDGYINRIPTRKYNRFSIRMYSSKRTAAQLFWFYNQRWTNFGMVTFKVKKGWHTYVVNVTSSGQWKGRPIGLRLDPTFEEGVDIKVDWMRLYKYSKRRVVVAWLDDSPQGTTEIFVDEPKQAGSMELVGTVDSSGSNSFLWDSAPYPPGSYRFTIKKQNGASFNSQPIVISGSPLTKILNPDETGGKDYAGTVLRNPWDMNHRSDIWYWRNLKNVRFSRGIMSATPSNGDGYFHLNVPKPIASKKYHRLVFRIRYDGPFHYGHGTMSRVIWSRDHNTLSLFQTINDIVIYPKWTTYVIDLKKAKLDGGKIGWRGKVNDFRFDPLEWRARRRFHIDYIKIKADDEGDKSFKITWRDYKRSPRRTRINLFYDKNRRGFDGRLIKKNLIQKKGVNSFVWNTKKVKPGKYYIYAVAKDGVYKTKRYSSGPVVIKHKKR